MYANLVSYSITIFGAETREILSSPAVPTTPETLSSPAAPTIIRSSETEYLTSYETASRPATIEMQTQTEDMTAAWRNSESGRPGRHVSSTNWRNCAANAMRILRGVSSIKFAVMMGMVCIILLLLPLAIAACMLLNNEWSGNHVMKEISEEEFEEALNAHY